MQEYLNPYEIVGQFSEFEVEELKIAMRFFESYTPNKSSSKLTLSEVVEAAKLVASGQSQHSTASILGTTREQIRQSLKRVTLAAALTRPELINLDDALEYRGGTSPKLFDRVRTIHNDYRLLSSIIQSDNQLASRIRTQPHLTEFLILLTDGYRVNDIALKYGVSIPKSSESTLSKTLFHSICSNNINLGGLHALLKRIVFRKWIDKEIAWNGRVLYEEEYAKLLNQHIEKGGSQYIQHLKVYQELRGIVNQNPQLYFGALDMDPPKQFPYSGLSPASLVFINTYAEGSFDNKQLANLFKEELHYSLSYLEGAISAGTRFTENLLLINIWSWKDSLLNKSRATDIKNIMLAIGNFVADSKM